MKKYEGRWMDLFKAYEITDNELPHLNGKICLETPDMDYFLTKAQWNEFKEKVNQV